jgi:hypothetical protein
MDKHSLPEHLLPALKAVRDEFEKLGTADQYQLLGHIGWLMDRDVVRHGTVRAAAASASAVARTARVTPSSKAAGKAGPKNPYPAEFVLQEAALFRERDELKAQFKPTMSVEESASLKQKIAEISAEIRGKAASFRP